LKNVKIFQFKLISLVDFLTGHSHSFIYLIVSRLKNGVLTEDTKKIEALKLVSTNSSKSPIFETVMPSGAGDEFDKKWFENWYEKGDGKKYLAQDLRTKEGRTFVAKFAEFESDWLNGSKDHTEETPVHEIIFDFLLAYTQNGSGFHIYGGPKEGMHRTLGQFQAMVASVIEDSTGLLARDVIDINDFENAGLISEDLLPYPTSETLMSSINKTLRRENEGMMDKHVAITGIYVSDDKTDVPELMKAMRDSSRAISDDKLDSARPRPSHQIGDWGERFIMSMELNNVTFDAMRHDVTVAKTKRPTLKEVEEKLTQNDDDENKAYPVCELLEEKEYQDYCKDPFDDVCINAVKELLHLKMETGTGVVVKSMCPHLVTFDSLARKVGPATGPIYLANAEILNEYFIGPVVIRILFAGMNNMSIGQTRGNQKVMEYIRYITRYHFGAESGFASTWKIHNIVKKLYRNMTTGFGDVISGKGYQLIGASVLITNMINAVIGGVSHNKDLKGVGILNEVKLAAKLFGSAFKSIDSHAGNPSIESTVTHLGKCRDLLLFG
jgi:hypothetical protein